MALPKQRTSTQRKGKRRRGQPTGTLPHLIRCASCRELKKPHRICPNCGKYKDFSIKGDEKKKRSAPQKKTENN